MPHPTPSLRCCLLVSALLLWILPTSPSLAGVVLDRPDLPPESEPADCTDVQSHYRGAGLFAVYPGGISLSEVSQRCFRGVVRDLDPASGDETQTFESVMECVVDLGGGPEPVILAGPVTVVVRGKGSSTTGSWDTEMISMDLSGSVAGTIMTLRESSALPSTGHTTVRDLGDGQWQIDSFFDVFTEITVSGGPLLRQSNPAEPIVLRRMTSSVAFPTADLPPGSSGECDEQTGEYEARGIVASYPGGLVVSDVLVQCFTNLVVTPIAGTPDVVYEFDALAQGVANAGSGPMPLDLAGPISVVVRGKGSSTTGSWDTEMISMDLSGDVGGIPVVLRESPQLPSPGHTTVVQDSGSFQIDSFFDVFTEISIGGAGFQPQVDAAGALTLRRRRPTVVLPSPGLPPEVNPPDCDDLASQFVFAGVDVRYPGDIILSDFVQRCFENTTKSFDSMTGDVTYEFDTTMIGEAGGPTSAGPVVLSGPIKVVVHDKGGSTTGSWDTEIVSMSLSGDLGGVPVAIQESPSLPSSGETSVVDVGGGRFRVDSFFDVFTEISVGGGAFQPQLTPAARMELDGKPPTVVLPSPGLPPEPDPPSCVDLVSQYEAQGTVSYPGGLRLASVVSRCFQNVDTRTDPFGDETSSFDSTVEAMVDQGASMVPVTLTGPVTVVVRGKGTSTTGTWDTEMISMDLTGDVGGVPVVIRESPDASSSGVTGVRAIGGGQYEIDSFFDVFTEVSIGGGPFEPQEGPPARLLLLRVEHEVGIPSFPSERALVLYDAEPNPWNPFTTLSFEISSAVHVRMAIYDVAGRLVRTLVDETMTAGRHHVVWKGRDSRNQPVASGVYLYHVNAGSHSEAKSMVLMK